MGDGFTIDHVIPSSRGGSDDLDNLVGCCRRCNASKGARPLSALRIKPGHWADRPIIKPCKKHLRRKDYPVIDSSRVHQLRKEQKLSMRELGERAGVSWATIFRAESSRFSDAVRPSTAHKLAEALGVEPATLMAREISIYESVRLANSATKPVVVFSLRPDRPPRLTPEELRAFRERLGWTPRQLANALDADAGAVWRWELPAGDPRGRKIPGPVCAAVAAWTSALGWRAGDEPAAMVKGDES